MARAVEVLTSTTRPDEAWRAWTSGAARVRGLATAFASKVAYFAAYDRKTGVGPLICDANTTWAYWLLTDRWDSRASAGRYAHYVEDCGRWAQDLDVKPDDIERSLFMLGPAFRDCWKALDEGAKVERRRSMR